MRSKYRNIKTVCGSGQKHDSKLEARRCDELHLLQEAGEISELQAHPQPSYELKVEGVLICRYRPDFEYLDHKLDWVVTEDTKSKATMTATYRIKKKLMKAIYGIEITEVFETG